MHDVFEGLVSQDLLGVLRILKSKKWLTIEEYNENLANFKFMCSESSDKPQAVPLNQNVKKLIGKAVSIWVHVRNFPFLIRKFVRDEEEPALILGLKLHELVERITATEFREYEISVLEEKVIGVFIEDDVEDENENSS